MLNIKRGNIETTLELIDIDAIDFNDKTFRFRLEITKEELRQLDRRDLLGRDQSQ